MNSGNNGQWTVDRGQLRISNEQLGMNRGQGKSRGWGKNLKNWETLRKFAKFA
jgi:hypothetical protein